jgi:hypothetical protein
MLVSSMMGRSSVEVGMALWTWRVWTLSVVAEGRGSGRPGMKVQKKTFFLGGANGGNDAQCLDTTK